MIGAGCHPGVVLDSISPNVKKVICSPLVELSDPEQG